MNSLFNPLNFAISPTTIPGLGDLFEHRLGYSVAQVIFDTIAPNTQIVINEDVNSGGIDVIWFQALNTSVLSSQDYVLDSLGNITSVVLGYGGSANPSEFQTIGNSEISRSIIKYLNNQTVSSIQFGCISAIPKSYVIEVQSTANSSWLPIIYFYSSNITTDFFSYVLATPQSVYALRLRYTGDFYTTSNSGTLSVSSSDTLSGTSAIRISHYIDFRDAFTVSGSNAEGWIPYTDGYTVFNNFPLLNTNYLWTQQAGTAASGFENLVNTSNGILGVTSNSVYSYNPITGNINTVPLYVTPSGITISSHCVYQTNLFIGLSNGQIISGVTFLPISVSFTNPVTALCSFQGELWIGTSILTVANTTNGVIYNWNGYALALANQVQQPQISGLYPYGSYLYAGTGGISGQASLYSFSNVSGAWIQAWNPIAPATKIDNITFSTELSALVVTVSSGSIYTNVTSSSTGLSSTWTQIFNGAQNFYDVVDDTTGEYLFVVGSTGLQIYAPTNNSNPVFTNIPYPNTSATINDVVYIPGTGLYGAGSDGNIYLLDTISLDIVASGRRRIYIEALDQAGNTTFSAFTGSSSDDTLMGYALDDIVIGSQTVNGSSVSGGSLYQVDATEPVPNEIATFTSAVSASLYSPNRTIFETGTYISTPLYEATISSWGSLSMLVVLPAGGTPAAAGLSSGVEVDLYVRASDDITDLENATWMELSTYSPMTNIGNTTATTSVGSYNYSLVSFDGQWLQFMAVLSTGTTGVTPQIQSVSINYYASQSSYFYTTLFDTSQAVSYNSNNPTQVAPYAQFRRFMLSANYILNGGTVAFGYTTDQNTFAFSNFTKIAENTIMELPTWSQYIRFGAQLTSLAEPVVIDDIGILADIGPENIFWL